MSVSNPLVSVCMPARRDNLWFRAALASALGQQGVDLEVVVSDDSGSGLLRAVVEQMDDPRVRYLRQPEPLGLAGNHVAAIEESRGEFTAFLHDDDEWEPLYLVQALKVFRQHPSVGLVLAGCDEIDEDGRWLRRRTTTLRPGLQDDALASLLDDGVMLMLPSAAVFRRTALEANPRPWPNLPAADMTMFIDVAAAGWGVYYTEQVLMRYRMHDAQVGGDQLIHRDAVVKVWDGYTFTGLRHERLRRRRLARDLIARAGELIRRGDIAAARSDLGRARQMCWYTGLPRTVVLHMLTLAPGLAGSADQVWNRVGRRGTRQ